ncbi:uncharacterized protein LOC128956334 [Oppia nitens]|uniref:uncharacterized protein LOC128956334 n=1 Tax=Oppia nitens TaxID=1686743 RepID=UPI0023DBE134|nr:uncharacterized protein LOC128956334 [Oppia nitens]
MIDKNIVLLLLSIVVCLQRYASAVPIEDEEQLRKYMHMFRVAKREAPENATEIPVASTTYDWGQWTSRHPSRTTYDWGQWTSTKQQPTGTESTTGSPTDVTEVPTVEPTTESHQYRCAAGKYGCKGTIGLCISLDQICDQHIDCPHGDDEQVDRCFHGFRPIRRRKHVNSFAGTGFMFGVRNLVVNKGTNLKAFNQFSDNVVQAGDQKIA